MYLHSLGALENLCACTRLKEKSINVTMILISFNVLDFIQMYTLEFVRSGFLSSNYEVQAGVNY